MELKRYRRWIGALAALGLVLALLRHRPARVVEHGAREAHPYRVRGALHVHTGLSEDARGSIQEVAESAHAAGLDFIVVTDHGTEAASTTPTFEDGVLVLGGLEKSTDAGHALVLGTPALPFRLDGDPSTVVADAQSFGGFVIAAHPTSRRAESAWTGGLDGVPGLEIMNLAEPQAWPERGPALLWPLLRYLADPEGTLLREFRFNREAVRAWDQQLRQRPLAGLLGSDAHGGFPAGSVFVPMPSHTRIFGLASQHLLLRERLSGDPPSAGRQILEAVRVGRGYVGIDALASASGFQFEAETEGRRAVLGESLPLTGEATLRAWADSPTGTTLVLLRDGQEVARGERVLHTTRAPGVYRVEAYLHPRWSPGRETYPWILSNAIALFTPEELAARARRLDAAPPEDGLLPPAARELVDDFERAALRPSWQVDRSPDAAGVLRQDEGALHFAFALGPEAVSHASACDWTERDLSAYRALVFRVRSDRPLRFDVQVRTSEGGTEAGGVRVWRRSVRSGDEWRWINVPFSSLKNYDRRGERPDLRHVHGVYFHVDEANLPPASRGTVWIDDLGLGS